MGTLNYQLIRSTRILCHHYVAGEALGHGVWRSDTQRREYTVHEIITRFRGYAEFSTDNNNTYTRMQPY